VSGRVPVVAAAAVALWTAMAAAGKADVVRVEAIQESAEEWTFAVTVRHADRDPDHWADWWRVRTPGGRELGRRVLLHSHVDEQPFTRDERIRIPPDVPVVVVEAHDKVHRLGGATVTVDLRRADGPGYTVRRRSR
jgi:hypothetical protein